MNVRAKTPGPGRPKDLEKRAAILEAAGRLFVELGFVGTSMDAIAAEAGVSKLTVYSHYGDKDNLFLEAVSQVCHDMLPEHLYKPEPGAPLREVLQAIARSHVRLMISPEAVGVWRAISADCHNGSPRMGRLFWEAGPGRSRALMERFLAEQVDAGTLDIDDVGVAAMQFILLIKGDLHMRHLLGCSDCVESDLEQEAIVDADAAVDMFLRAYAPR